MTLTYDSYVKMMSIELHDNGRSLKKKIPYDPNLGPSRKDGTIPARPQEEKIPYDPNL